MKTTTLRMLSTFSSFQKTVSIIGVLSIVFLTSCKSGNKATQPEALIGTDGTIVGVSGENKIISETGGFKTLTSVGDNSWPRFSPDGTKILFSSRQRPSHSHAQIYELNLTNMSERRITHHDGDATSPVYFPKSEAFLYSSQTDELKEERAAMNRLMKTYHPEAMKNRESQTAADEVAEIYSQNLNGRDPERLTRSEGYDGDLDIDSTGKRVAFTSSRTGKQQIYLTSPQFRDVKRISDGEFQERSPRFSPDGDILAWVRESADGSSSQIMMMNLASRQIKALTTGISKDTDPEWSVKNGGELIFSSNRGGKSFNLYSVASDGTCIKRLTDVEIDQLQSSMSPDGKIVVFTGFDGTRRTLHAMPYSPPQNCEPQSSLRSGSN